MTAYVAPAHKVLTELHRADPTIPPVTTGPDPSSGATVCGRQMLTEGNWIEVERRPGDRICAGCEGRAEPEMEPLW